jgi:hypothetical protein
MQAVIALTAAAKQRKLDKYTQHTLRVWYLHEVIENCNKAHMSVNTFTDNCPRCYWLTHICIRGCPPTYHVRKFLKAWYVQ